MHVSEVCLRFLDPHPGGGGGVQPASSRQPARTPLPPFGLILIPTPVQKKGAGNEKKRKIKIEKR